MIATVFAPAVSAAGEGKGIDLNASVKEPKPEIAISVDVDHISFGELLPGETSDSNPVKVTNIGLKALDITADVEDDGSEAIFAAGITVNGAAWNNYSAQLVSDGSDSFDVALHIPETAVTRGNISGSLTVWAEAIETPVAEFTAAPLSAFAPLTMRFTDLSANAPTSWLWNFGNGNTSTEKNPVHTYASAGTYAVSLTVTNSAGSDSATTAVEVKLNIYSTAANNTNPGAPDAGIPGFVGPDGIGKTGGNNYVNPVFVAWASKVIDYSPSIQGTSINDPAGALGPVASGLVGLGDLDQASIDAGYLPGSIVIGFDVTITNGEGPDFAAFENGFISEGGAGVAGQIFAELGYVEVSTDGNTFVRFPSVSLTPGLVGGYGTVDPTNVYNLVGKHVNYYGSSWGTPFDLSDLVNAPEVLSGVVDLNDINFVRIVDIPGNGHYKDSLGNPIYDAWLTGGTGGMDFDGLGVINSKPKTFDADFSASPTSGDAPLTVQFTDLSVDAVAWKWDFNNDGVVDSTEQNPAYVFSYSGTYTIKLTITNSKGASDDEVKANYVLASGPASPDDFTYASDGSSITITGYRGPGGIVIIPDEIDGLPVTAIGNNAFQSVTVLVSVTVPDSVTSIGNSAFRSCTALTSITIGSGMTTIGGNAFQYCTALTSVTVPDSVTSIGTYAFGGCSKLSSATIGNGVTSIGNYMFQYCTALTAITIGSGVETIGQEAFAGCTALTALNIDANNTAFASVDGILYNKNVSTLIKCPLGKSGSVAIPDGVTTISNQAFYQCTALTSVVIPDSVTSIGQSVFGGCTKLTSVTIGSGVTSIGTNAFQGCTALTAINVDADNTAFASVDGLVYDKAVTTLMLCPRGTTGSVAIPDGVTSIGNGAFTDCSAITSVTIPDSVTSIGDNAFYQCFGLTSVNIGSGVTTIGSGAFFYCNRLTSVTIPDSVTSLGPSTFRLCERLTSVTIGNSVTSIGNGVFQTCTALTSVIIPNSVTSIGNSAFSDCKALTTVTIGNGVTTIDIYAFQGCIALTSVTIGSGVTSIGNGVFQTCTALTSVAIPDNVITIGQSVFAGCTKLTSVTIGSGVTSIGNYAFQYCVALTAITIGSGVETIGQETFAGCTALTAINADANNSALASIDGILYNKNVSTLIMCPLGKSGSVTIPDGVTSIGNSAFYGCTALTSIEIPDSVTSIGNSAFRGCTGLTSVSIPKKIITIGNSAFYQCTGLTSVTIPDGVTTIGNNVFQGCTGLTSIEIPDSVTSIGNNAFNGCTKLASVAIGSGLNSIGNNAFNGCTGLTAINVDAANTVYTSVDGILYNKDVTTMVYCPLGKVSVTIPNGVTSIPSSAFYGYTKLTSVTIPDSVTSIGSYAFYGCTALTAMIFKGNAPTVDTYWAYGCTKLVVYYNEGASGFTTPTWNDVPCYPAVAPTAGLSANAVSGFAPLTVQFTDLSTNSPSSWAWDFDNDGNVDSTAKNPSWTYDAPGTYTVTLTVGNPFGNDTVVKTAFITVTEAPPASDWAFFQGNQQLNGYHPGNAPDDNNQKWVSAYIDAWPSSSFAIAEGKVFVYCYNETEEKAYIAALYVENGTIAWMEPMLTNPLWDSWATPAYHDGLVFTAGDTARYASNGTIAWPEGRTVGTASTTNGGPMIAEGKVFVGDWDGHHYFAYDEKTGEQVWQFTVPGYAQGTPSYHDGKLFLTSWANGGGNIYCLNANDGTEVWHSTTPGDTCGSPSIAGGYVYVTTYNFGGDGDIYCFYESNGTEAWRQTIQRTDSTPTVFDGRVYVTGGCFGVSPHQTYCFDAFDGTPIWSTTEEQDIGGWTSSVVVADGKVFVGREGDWGDGMRFGYIGLFALDIENGEVLWEAENGGATVAIYDGVVFTAGIDGRVYAYGPAA